MYSHRLLVFGEQTLMEIPDPNKLLEPQLSIDHFMAVLGESAPVVCAPCLPCQTCMLARTDWRGLTELYKHVNWLLAIFYIGDFPTNSSLVCQVGRVTVPKVR